VARSDLALEITVGLGSLHNFETLIAALGHRLNSCTDGFRVKAEKYYRAEVAVGTLKKALFKTLSCVNMEKRRFGSET